MGDVGHEGPALQPHEWVNALCEGLRTAGVSLLTCMYALCCFSFRDRMMLRDGSCQM